MTFGRYALTMTVFVILLTGIWKVLDFEIAVIVGLSLIIAHQIVNHKEK